MNRELIYLLLIFGLLVIPRALQRFKIPAPITCLVFGIGAMLAWGVKTHDPVVTLLSTLGISSLFLFAGLEVDLRELRRGLWPLLTHLAVRIITLAGAAWLAWHYLDLGWQASALLALALLTPSTGFILDTLERLGLDEEERFWVTSKAIAGELLALAALFVIMQAGDPMQLGVSTLVMLGMLVGWGALAGAVWLAWHYLYLGGQASAVLARALLTPSTGCIRDTLERLGLDEEERFWVTSKAIAGELLALAALFVIMQAGDPMQLGVSTLVMLGMLVGLPMLFIAFGRWIVPHAPGSEFSLLVMVGFLAAFITYKLGVYYLVGAFIAGLIARLLRIRMPRLASNRSEEHTSELQS